MDSCLLFVGHNTIDHTFVVDELPAAGQVKPAVDYDVQGGGMAAGAAVAAARLGGRAYYVGQVGDDDNGRLVADWLKDDGVDTRFIHILIGYKTAIAAILVRRVDGERTIIPFDDAMPDDAVTLPTNEFLETVDVALFDAHLMRATLALAPLLAEHDAKIVGDFAHDYAGLDTLMPYVTHPILPMTYAVARAGNDDIETILDTLIADSAQRFAAVTHGARGCWGKSAGGDVVHIPALPVHAVDTCGCGDAFHGAFAFGLGHGLAEVECLALSSIVAGLKSTRLGARAGLPTLDAVRTAWKKHEGLLGVACPI